MYSLLRTVSNNGNFDPAPGRAQETFVSIVADVALLKASWLQLGLVSLDLLLQLSGIPDAMSEVQ